MPNIARAVADANAIGQEHQSIHAVADRAGVALDEEAIRVADERVDELAKMNGLAAAVVINDTDSVHAFMTTLWLDAFLMGVIAGKECPDEH